MAESSERTHNPKPAGSNPVPATKRTLGIPACAGGFFAMDGLARENSERILELLEKDRSGTEEPIASAD